MSNTESSHLDNSDSAAANGASVNGTVQTMLRAEGFSCPSCVEKIEKQLMELDGVNSVTVHFASSRIEVEHNPEVATEDALVDAVSRVGYKSHVADF